MSNSWRANAIAFGICVILIAGCDKNDPSGKSPAPGGGPTTPPKSEGGVYAKKLVGTWEASEDVGGKAEIITAEFKTDGGFKMLMGPFEIKGTWKLVKEEGKTVTVSTEAALEGLGDPKAPPKMDKKTLKAVFEDDNTVVISKEEGKPEPLKFKRKK